MSFRTQLPPTKFVSQGFVPLSGQSSYPNMQESDIPLTTVQSNNSSSGARKAGANTLTSEKTFPQDDGNKKGFMGRRKVQKTNKRRVGTDGEEETTTAMGKIYNKIVNFSIVTRYLVFVIPVAGVLAVPIVITATGGRKNRTTIGGVKQLYFWIWLEIVWLSIWVAKLVAKALPAVFMFLCGVVSSGTRKYALIIKNLEVPLSLIGWAATCLATYKVLTSLGDNPGPMGWVAIMNKLLTAALISAGIYLGEKLVIQMISMNYHKRSFDNRIKDSKHMVYLICLLYDASRTMFPMYCREFEEEDLIINDSVEAMLGSIGGHKRSGSVTPMRLIGNIGRLGDKVTSVFGNIASEITGKEVFNPSGAHSIVVEALEKKRSSEALAKRLWMSFVVEGRESLMVEDIREVLGPARGDEADEIFATIDGDGNGDISLDEMIMKIVEIGRDRKSIASSMKDIGQAIRVLDQVLITIAFVIIIFVFVAFLNTSFVTFLATASTTLLSLSFVFAVTAQEFLGSCIFLFVKHPYDVGDRVDIAGPDGSNFVVDQISLLYTVFKRIDCMKMVQVPNIVLNSMWIDNVTRSRAMKEDLDVFVSFDTSIEDVELLRKEMETFVRHPDNNRDFQPDVIVECTGIGNMDKLQLKVEIRHKSNWSNETVRAARRSKFMCALVLALRRVPIYCPGGGNTPLGDPGNPSYSVAVSDEVAQAGRDKAGKAKEEKRLVPSKKDSGKSSGVDTDTRRSRKESKAADTLNARRPADDEGRDDTGTAGMTTTASPDSRDNSLERKNDINDLRKGLLKRESTRGRRRPGETVPPQPTSTGGPGFTITQASPRRLGGFGFDEESAMGMDSRYDNNTGYFPNISRSGGPLQKAPTAPPLQAPSYSMFPPSNRSQTGVLHPLGSSPPNLIPGRSRGLSIGQNQSPQKNQNSTRL